MHDIRSILSNYHAFVQGLARRGEVSPRLQQFFDIARARSAYIVRKEDLQAKIKDNSAKYGRLKAQGKENSDEANIYRVGAIDYNNALKEIEPILAGIERNIQDIIGSLPNLALADVPDGNTENDNVLIHERGRISEFDFTAAEHDVIGPALGLDFDTGVKLAGARFTLLRGHAARLHGALGQFMLATLASDHGYEQVVPPLLVRDEAMFGTGQLPKFADDLFRTTDGRWLIPTAEVTLTNIVRESILSEDELPLRFTALTACFRSEAGAAGRDTRGFIRQHQFEKAEMVSITTPDTSEAEHERMTQAAEDILTRLGLPFRRMKLCTGDMGFAAARTYDLEVWLPGQGRYREISSCSTCTDFQARRMNARYRPAGEKGTRFVHTLNGSGLAVGRTLVAVIENYQQEGGAVAVPEVLQPWLGGLNRLEPKA
jgi:seryl-tRNA synthetase